MHSLNYTVQPRAWLALATNTAPRPPDAASADRCIVITWTPPVDPDPDIVRLLATPGEDREAYLRACLRWLVVGAQAFLRDGLGVPDFARPAVEPAGLAAWWDDCIESGSLRVGQGWTPLEPFAESAAAWHRNRGESCPTPTALGSFLGTRMEKRRALIAGRKVAQYRATVVDGVGRG